MILCKECDKDIAFEALVAQDGSVVSVWDTCCCSDPECGNGTLHGYKDWRTIGYEKLEKETSTTDAVYDITSNRGYAAAAVQCRRQLALGRRWSGTRDMSAESRTALEDLCVALEDGIAEMRITQEKVDHAMQTWVARR